MIHVNKVLHTDGRGYWSNVAKPVTVIGLDLGYVSDDNDFGELCVYFDTATWDVDQDGLIYTDKKFMSELKELLAKHGLPQDVTYSEQGMQGNDYVSLDVNGNFILSFRGDWLDQKA